MKNKGNLTLQSCACLYLDEIIDAKFINNGQNVVMCSNSETLKIVDLNEGNTEIYGGHADIIISLDVYESSHKT